MYDEKYWKGRFRFTIPGNATAFDGIYIPWPPAPPWACACAPSNSILPNLKVMPARMLRPIQLYQLVLLTV